MLGLASVYLDGLEWLEPYAMLLVRVAVGAMFALSGWHKLFVPERRRVLEQTLKHDDIPYAQLNLETAVDRFVASVSIWRRGRFCFRESSPVGVSTLRVQLRFPG